MKISTLILILVSSVAYAESSDNHRRILELLPNKDGYNHEKSNCLFDVNDHDQVVRVEGISKKSGQYGLSLWQNGKWATLKFGRKVEFDKLPRVSCPDVDPEGFREDTETIRSDAIAQQKAEQEQLEQQLEEKEAELEAQQEENNRIQQNMRLQMMLNGAQPMVDSITNQRPVETYAPKQKCETKYNEIRRVYESRCW